MREVICGYLKGRKILVDKLTGEASLLGNKTGKCVLTGLLIANPIDHSNDDVCKRLTEGWGTDGVIMSNDYFVKLSGSTAEFFTPADFTTPFFTTLYGTEIIED